MKNIIKKTFLLGVIVAPTAVLSAPLNDFTFKNPSFNGTGFSSHILTIENQESTRRKAIADKVQAELDKIKAEEKNTNLNKFLNNLESRIYAQISQNLATAMFADGGTDSGSFTFDKATNTTIGWVKDPLAGTIKLTVNGPGVNSEITVPLGQFQF
jgi:hypothetical protein